MAEQGFHFAEPLWFLALLVLPLVAYWLWRSTERAHKGPLYRYADAHLLPHLTGSREFGAKERWGRFGAWALLWTLAALALAGPRWNYTDVRLFNPGNNLLVLLDISRSMQVPDSPPTRLARAKQEIQDLINLNQGVRIGLIAFASVPFVATPITEDRDSIRRVLPALETELAQLQGSRLLLALDRAEMLLDGLPQDSAKTLLLISDGDFDEPGLADRVRELAKKEVRVLTLGVGTREGGQVPSPRGGMLTDMNRRPIQSRLNESLLKSLAEAGNGQYWDAVYQDSDSQAILAASNRIKPAKDERDERTRVWNEQFHWLLLPLLAILVPAFRRHPTRRKGL